MDPSNSPPGQAGPDFNSMDAYSQGQNGHGQPQLSSQLPFVSYSGTNPVPYNLVHFYNNDQGPWNHIAPTGSVQQDAFIPSMNSYAPPLNPGHYRGHVLASECDASLPGEDSGYGSRAPPSTGLPSRVDAEFPDGEDRLRQIQLDSHPPKVEPNLVIPRTVSRPRQMPATGNFPCQRPGCGASLKTKSELNKHLQRHDKPHVCETPQCPRKHGFSTKNDLQRHQKTVHRESHGDSQTYCCTYLPCLQRKPTKIWPRADNFRQHLQRVHQIEKKADEDLTRFLRRPEQKLDLEADSLTGIGTFETFDTLPRPSTLIVSETTESPQDKPADETQHPDVVMEEWHGYQSMPVSGGLELSAGGTTLTSNPQEQRPPSFTHADMSNHGVTGQPCQEPISQLYPPQFGHHTNLEMQRNPLSFDLEHNETMQPPSGRPTSRSSPQISQTSHDTAPDRSSTPDSSDDDASIIGSTSVGAPTVRPDIQHTLKALPGLLANKRQTSDNASSVAECLRKLLPPDVLSSAVQLLMANEPFAPEPELEDSKTPYQCEACPKRFGRQCELRKHMKRHEKPYGCTWRDCGKEFGSKNDWKRHESSQHLRLETWSCEYPGCTKVCNRRESFKNHLIKEHNLKPDVNLEQQLDKRRLGRHCERLYWCGFCKSMQTITQSNVNCWTVRCDHIDNHICGRNGQPKMSMSSWEHLEDESCPGSPAPGMQPSAVANPVRLNETPVRSGLKRKNVALEDGRPRKQVQKQLNFGWCCCRCADQLMLTYSDDSCTGCSHPRCTDCQTHELKQPRQRKQTLESTV